MNTNTENKLESARELADTSEQSINTIAKVIALPLKPWDTMANFYANAKRLLCIVTLWLRMRATWIEYSTAIGTLSDYAKDSIEPYYRFDNLRVSTWGSGWNQGKYDSRTIKATSLVAGFPEVEDLNTVAAEVRRMEQLAETADMLFRQSQEMLAEVPGYKECKKVLPVGGRLFYSILDAVNRGTLSTTKPDQNNLFGFEDGVDKFDRLLRHGQRSLRLQRERKGRAPSWRQAIDSVPNRELPREAKRLPDRLRSFNKALPVELQGTCSHTWVASPTLYKLAENEGYRNANALIQRICYRDGVRNDIPTVWLSRPQRLQGNDYVVEAAWLVGGNGWRSEPRRIVRGWVYLRAGWNDYFHSETELTAREASDQLDESSEWWFRNLQSIEERRLSERQRQAKLLRRLRNVPAICLDDSYAVGNCNVGTADFVNRLGVSGPCATGHDLAIAWRAAGYPQRERFIPAVEYAEKRVRRIQSEFFAWGASN